MVVVVVTVSDGVGLEGSRYWLVRVVAAPPAIAIPAYLRNRRLEVVNMNFH